MKIVINKCHGGFGLSGKAIARIAELQGKTAYFFTGGFGSRPRVQIQLPDEREMFWIAYSTPNPIPNVSAERWAEMTYEQRSASNRETEAEHIKDYRDDRTNPILIKVVDELGEAASGACSDLRIIEIPDDTEYEIDEYDGLETVREKHRSWS